MEQQRLDVALVQRGLVQSRARARQLIEAGNVQLNKAIVTKPSYRVTPGDVITLRQELRYVSRGGYKLEAALSHFELSVEDLTILDVGASTGGFTDCLLQHGAVRVYAVDVGRGQLAPKLKDDSRVCAFEQTDIRRLKRLPESVDLIVVDVSFISLRLILPVLAQFLKPHAVGVVVLIKPQFEAGPGKTSKKGVIKDDALRGQIVEELLAWIKQQGWTVQDLIQSPIQGGDGNIEHLAYLRASCPDDQRQV
jgi:23S rRNA (cytidine1920-2'-O)/16S rRNA (cytidine1409-2'-O)-methyltransferase